MRNLGFGIPAGVANLKSYEKWQKFNQESIINKEVYINDQTDKNKGL